MPEPRVIETTCCIAGGGPAGMMLGYLLARAGVDAVVLEKHADFFRDFRGDTVHPSTLEVMYELGILDDFLRLPHQKLSQVNLSIEGRDLRGPDFSHLPVHCRFVALMPQWDFLNFLASQARRYPTFGLHMQTEVTDLVEAEGRVTGVRARTPDGELVVKASLVVACDGRHSTVRERAGLAVRDFGVPIDVIWFRISAPTSPDTASLGRVSGGRLLVTIPRGDYYQCGLIIRKGALPEIQRQGLPAFRSTLVALAPYLAAGAGELTSWDQVNLLTVQVNRLTSWHRPGLLCIGDAAHAMSPAGGVGINYAVQDAVATANLLAEPLRRRTPPTPPTAAELDRVQRRREPPVRRMQAIQVFLHRRMVGGPAGAATVNIPWPVRALLSLLAPLLRRIGARIVGIGFRPEHVATADTTARP